MLNVEDLKTSFHTRDGTIRAVNGMSFDVERGQTLGIVGESGSGKTVACLSLLGLIPSPPGTIKGRALFENINLLTCSDKEIRKIRGNRISMIFQDPMTSLNPYLSIGDQLIEPLVIHHSVSRKKAWVKAIEILGEVGIHDGEKRMRQFPHVLSGGMRQRVMIAMALISEPDLLIADEPTTALDVTIQAQILDLIKKIQRSRGMAVIFITHDLGVIAQVAESVIVMYAGYVMERGSLRDIFYHTSNPYTKALMDSIPSAHVAGRPLFTIPGMPPDLSVPFSGCAFAPRCSISKEKCYREHPTPEAVLPGHHTTCFYHQSLPVSAVDERRK